MWQAGAVTATARIRRDDQSEWHPITIVQRHLDRRAGLTVGKMVGAILLASIVGGIIAGIFNL